MADTMPMAGEQELSWSLAEVWHMATGMSPSNALGYSLKGV